MEEQEKMNQEENAAEEAAPAVEAVTPEVPEAAPPAEATPVPEPAAPVSAPDAPLQKKKIKGKADIVFCVDNSGSMGPCITGIRSRVNEFITRLENGISPNYTINIDWRARVINYSDMEVDNDPIDATRPFVATASDLSLQLADIQAVEGRGGDEPESAFDAMYLAMQSEWREGVRKYIILLTDATAHPEISSKTITDAGQPRDLDNAILTPAANNKFIIILFGPDFELYERLTLIPKATYVKLGTRDEAVQKFQASESDPVWENIINTILKTVTATAAETPVWDEGS